MVIVNVFQKKLIDKTIATIDNWQASYRLGLDMGNLGLIFSKNGEKKL